METAGETTVSAWAEAQAKLWEQGITQMLKIMESASGDDRAELSDCGSAVRPMLEAQIERAQMLAASLPAGADAAEEDAELRAHLQAVLERWRQVHGRFWDLWLAALDAAAKAPPGGENIS